MKIGNIFFSITKNIMDKKKIIGTHDIDLVLTFHHIMSSTVFFD